MSLSKRAVACLSAILLSAISGFAQSNFGSIRGVVSDGSGAAVPAAKVIITDDGTNAKITLITGADGGFSAP